MHNKTPYKFLKTLALSMVFGLALTSAGFASYGDLAPTPKKAPLTPVKSQKLDAPQIHLTHHIQGAATILGTESLRLNDKTIRLFGIVPPQLSASFGPQARAVLDELNNQGDVLCVLRAQTNNGKLFASCQSKQSQDLALALLKKGLAVTARGSLQNSPLSKQYQDAEREAQRQRLGLWRDALPPVTKQQTAEKSDSAMPPKKPTREERATSIEEAEPQITGFTQLTAIKTPTPEEAPKTIVKDVTPTAEERAEAHQALSAPPEIKAETNPFFMEEEYGYAAHQTEPSLFERYQLFFTALLMMLTTLGVLASIVATKWLSHREEVRTLAAALRGELMAAKSLCFSRIKSDKDDSEITWPRIRTLVFQAHVGRLGLLGADLARKVASTYGQASDYTSYYADAERENTLSKKEALERLVDHIDIVISLLAEKDGSSAPSLLTLIKRALTTPPDSPKPGNRRRAKTAIKRMAVAASLWTSAALSTGLATITSKLEKNLQALQKAIEPKEETDQTAQAEEALLDVQKASQENDEKRNNIINAEIPTSDYASMTEEELEIMAYNMGYGIELDDEEDENATTQKAG